MLTELYIEALLVDEELADLVWEAWDSGLVSDQIARFVWLFMAARQISKSARIEQ